MTSSILWILPCIIIAGALLFSISALAYYIQTKNDEDDEK